MSEKNGKVCCNCRHNIRTGGKIDFVMCHCDIDGSWLSYITVMTYWCRHWSRDKAESEGRGMTKEDAISRAEALKIVDELNDGSSECANIKAEIEKLPSIQSKVKTGRWRPNFRFGMYFDEKFYICSECNKQSMEHSSYCPNCGVKMVDPQESEDKE